MPVETPPPAPPPPPRTLCTNPNSALPMLTFSTPLIREETLTIAAVGDVLLHEPLQAYAAEQPDGLQSLLRPVADLLAGADITFGNLEGPAAAGVYNTGREAKGLLETRYDGRVYTGYPMFNYHPSVVSDLKTLGFDVMTVANNHSLDRHALGVDRTIEAFQTAGLPFTGTRHRDAMSAPWYSVTTTLLNGRARRIAWLGCTYGTNEIPDPYGQVLNCFDQEDEVLALVAQLAADPLIDAVMVAPHWGREYRHDPTDRQRQWAKDVLDAGALAILGSHPHVLEPMESYLTKDGRETFVAFSLGNFISGQASLARRSSVILLLALTPGANGKLALADARYIPVRTVKEGAGYFVEALDRASDPDKYLKHILGLLPPGNVHPATAPFWTGAACAPPLGS